MKMNQVWSVEYSAPVSMTFAEVIEPSLTNIDLTGCIVIENNLGYYDLYKNKQKIKRITFDEYLKIRHKVKAVYIETDEYQYTKIEV